MEDLKNLTKEQKEEILQNIEEEEENLGKNVTKVESIHTLSKKSGDEIILPSAEELVAKASASLFYTRDQIKDRMMSMSKKEIIRSVVAFLSLPEDGIPVLLKAQSEKQLFMMGQRAIQDIFVVMYHVATKAALEERIRKELEAKESTTSEETVSNESD